MDIYKDTHKLLVKWLEQSDIEKIQKTLANTQEKIAQLDIKHDSFNLTDFLKEWLTRKEGIRGLSCGYPRFEKAIDRFNPGSLVVIAGRPAMGKTTFGLCIATNCGYYHTLENAVERGGDVVFFSLEMTKGEIYTKLFKRFLREDFKYFENTAENKEEEVYKVACKFNDYITSLSFKIEVPESRYYEDIEERLLYYIVYKKKMLL